MNSDNQTPQIPVPQNLSNSASAATFKPSAKEIMSALKPGVSPLDFIKANLKGPVEPQVSTVPQQTIAQIEAKRAEVEPPKPPEVEAPKPEDKKTAPPLPLSNTTEAPQSVPESAEGDKEENFKALRKKVSETSSALKEKEKEVETLQTKVKRYETGAELPEVLKAKEARIAELERYEKIHALKTSPSYKEKFIKPLETIKTKLSELAADYEIPKEVMERALNITNKRELNSFLSQNFDAVGALEVQRLLTEAQDLNTKAQEAEKEPSQALTALEQDFKNIEESRKARALEEIVETSKDAWVDSLIKIKEEGKIPELIGKENDPEYNKKYVEPVLQAASSEYGKIIKILAENGLRTLPKDVGFALARMVHLAHASGIAVAARTAAELEAEEIKKNAQRDTRYGRPLSMGGTTSSSGSSQGPVPASPKEAAQMLTQKILSRRSA